MTSVLIANRGEIAVRILRSAEAAGLRTIAVHTREERGARHVREAGEAVELPGDGVAAYLDVDALVDVAVASGADLVHPGYGFLSESAAFARALSAAGVDFVGPSAQTLELFGDKTSARALAERAGVPVLPASAAVQDVADAELFLATHPGRVVVKAVAGGGGRGIRVVDDPARMSDAIARASSEAARSFGDGAVYLERYLPRARHVEVQIVGDGAQVIHLGTRDCSLQRRHQKVVEFAPAPGIPRATEQAMTEAAVALGRAAGYRGIGTIEFLVDAEGLQDFFFIEGNPRLQVEHGVTELVTGIDLVALQFAIACGRSLAQEGLSQDVPLRGAAAEARVTAGAGRLVRFEPPGGVRVDTAAEVGADTGTEFDPLLAKLLVHERTSDDAVAALREAVEGLVIEGAPTNRDELRRLLDDPRVRALRLTTTLADELVGVEPAPASVLTASISGTVVAVLAGPGDIAAAGTPLVVVEAMKMEHEMTAPQTVRVDAVRVRVGERVDVGAVLCDFSPAEEGDLAPSAVAGPQTTAGRQDLAENRRRHEVTADAARPDAVAARHASGKRTARENVADLLDGELSEHGALVIAAQRRRRPVEELERTTPADGVITGFGPIDGVGQVAVVAYDYTVLAGTQGIQSHKKSERLFELARRRGTPVVVYAEGGGGRPGDVDNDAKATGMDLGTFVAFGRLSGVVPTVAIASGRCFAGTAALVGASDIVIATEDANIGMGGPAMIEGAGLGRVASEQIGPARSQFANGVVDVLVADEAEATSVARRYLSYFSDRRLEWTAHDQAELRDLVPENRARVFDIRRLILLLVDDDSVLELRGGFGRGVVTALARVEGASVGIVANDGTHLGGALDSDAADKMARFLRLCDTYGIPVVTLCDTPGFLVGTDSEDAAAVRHVGRLFVAGPNLSVPLCTVVVRKAWGLGGQAMAGGSFRVPDAIVAWPTAEFGAMGPEGAVRLGFKRELEAIEDDEEREAEFRRRVDDYIREGRAHRAASVFEIDDVIDPAQTRAWITASVRHAVVGERGVRPLDTW